ncbi:MAG TPA: YdcF family protein [Candidatus Binatia bacterium]|nr:YdcF family protein [Candidatus Binatia bacterium]
MKKTTALKWMALATIIYFAPQVWIASTLTNYSAETAPVVERAIVFGALVRDGQISDLHRERLLTGEALLARGKVQTLVVSNTPDAAAAMRSFLLERGAAPDQIEIDDTAETTGDSCRREISLNADGSVLLVSQSYHLPRVHLMCRMAGLTGYAVAAAKLDNPKLSLSVVILRAQRYVREAGLTWLVLMRIYR